MNFNNNLIKISIKFKFNVVIYLKIFYKLLKIMKILS